MPAQKIKLIGFAPDLPADTPGAIVDSQTIVPTTNGVANGLGISSVGTTKTGGPVLGILPGSYVATATKIYSMDLFGSTLSDVSGSTYSVGTGQLWSFAEFGTTSLAVNLSTNLQAFTVAASTFATVSTAPKASIVIVAGDPNASFAMCFDYNDGTNHYNDGVFWSALGDYTDWTPSVATEAGNIRLLDTQGGFTAAIPFRSGVVAFKANAMYLGTYVGGAAVWDWERISNSIGCKQQALVCEAEDVLYFMDSGALWVFDGSYPRRAPGYVSDYLVAQGSASAGQMLFDVATHNLWVPYGAASGHTGYVVYNVRSGLWTNHSTITDGTNYAGYLSNLSSGVTDGTTFGICTVGASSVSTGAAPYFRIASVGAPFGMTTVRGVRPEFLSGPSDSSTGWLSGTLYFGPSLRNVTGNSIAMSVDATSADQRADRLDVVQTARFLSPKISITKNTTFEVGDVYIDARTAGDE